MDDQTVAPSMCGGVEYEAFEPFVHTKAMHTKAMHTKAMHTKWDKLEIFRIYMKSPGPQAPFFPTHKDVLGNSQRCLGKLTKMSWATREPLA
jgi:hypothetical protein